GLAVATVGDPGVAQRREAARDVDLRVRVGVGARRVVDPQRRVRLAPRLAGAVVNQCVAERDLAKRHPYIGAAAGEVDLVRAGERAAGDALGQRVGIDIECGLGHLSSRGGLPAWSAAESPAWPCT